MIKLIKKFGGNTLEYYINQRRTLINKLDY